tara:strand:- start:21 stop:236 length:216 start_codon:yes stop_codon:yes gene_type:complete
VVVERGVVEIPQQEEMQVLVVQEVEEEIILQHLHLRHNQEHQELPIEEVVEVEWDLFVHQQHLALVVQESL